MINNIEQYKNLVELLKQALLFYGDKNNYNNSLNAGYEQLSLIDADEGHQARFALNQIDIIEEALNDFTEETEKEITAEDIFKKLNNLKNDLI